MPSRESYHREDLRGELLEGGHAHVAAEGHETLSVRALAVRVGVSPGAPYHYFPDRRSLLLALAVDGFEQLFQIGEAVAAGLQPPADRLISLADAFLGFQKEHPRLLELMYESELTRPKIEDAIAAQQQRGFTLLGNAIAAAVPGLDVSETRRRAVVFWASMFGYASLTGKGLLQPYAESLDEAAGWRAAAIHHAVSAAIAFPHQSFRSLASAEAFS